MWLPAPGASGPHRGLTQEELKKAKFSVPWEIIVLCISGTSVDVAMFEALHTTIDTNGCYDLLDVKTIQDSWVAAAKRNAIENAG